MREKETLKEKDRQFFKVVKVNLNLYSLSGELGNFSPIFIFKELYKIAIKIINLDRSGVIETYSEDSGNYNKNLNKRRKKQMEYEEDDFEEEDFEDEEEDTF